jgi:hypothetical protein
MRLPADGSKVVHDRDVHAGWHQSASSALATVHCITMPRSRKRITITPSRRPTAASSGWRDPAIPCSRPNTARRTTRRFRDRRSGATRRPIYTGPSRVQHLPHLHAGVAGRQNLLTKEQRRLSCPQRSAWFSKVLRKSPRTTRMQAVSVLSSSTARKLPRVIRLTSKASITV